MALRAGQLPREMNTSLMFSINGVKAVIDKMVPARAE